MQAWKIVRYVARKAAKLALLLVILSLLSFMLVSYSPVDPVQSYVGADMMLVGSEQRDNIAEYWGMNKPKTEQFWLWARALLTGDLGTSVIFRSPVADVIAERLTASLALMGVAWLVSGVLGFLLGILAGMKQGTWIDRFITWYCFTLASTPTFWLALLLVTVFSVWLGWLPVGLGTPAGVVAENVTLSDKLIHLVLPAFTLSIVGVANVAMHTRQKLLEVLQSEYVQYAIAKGEHGVVLLWRHGLRNVSLPAVSLHFASAGELFGGAVLAEQVFAYPGLGQATVQAGLRGDVPLLLGIVLISAILVFAGNVLADVLYKVIDPRIRKGGTL